MRMIDHSVSYDVEYSEAFAAKVEAAKVAATAAALLEPENKRGAKYKQVFDEHLTAYEQTLMCVNPASYIPTNAQLIATRASAAQLAAIEAMSRELYYPVMVNMHTSKAIGVFVRRINHVTKQEYVRYISKDGTYVQLLNLDITNFKAPDTEPKPY
jgi:hypothetical protein